MAARPLPPALPPLPVDPSLVAALAMDTGIAPAMVRRWLEGGAVPSDMHEALRASLWRPLGGIR